MSRNLYHRKLEELANKAGKGAFSKSKSEWYCTAENKKNVIDTFKKGEINLVKYQTIIMVSVVCSTSERKKKPKQDLKKELLGNETNGLI